MIELLVYLGVFCIGMAIGALIGRRHSPATRHGNEIDLPFRPNGKSYVQCPTSDKRPPTPASMRGIPRIPYTEEEPEPFLSNELLNCILTGNSECGIPLLKKLIGQLDNEQKKETP